MSERKVRTQLEIRSPLQATLHFLGREDEIEIEQSVPRVP